MGEPDKDECPVDARPGERPSHGRLGPVPKRSRECAAAGIGPANGQTTEGLPQSSKRSKKVKRRMASPGPASAARLRSAAGFHGVSRK